MVTGVADRADNDFGDDDRDEQVKYMRIGVVLSFSDECILEILLSNNYRIWPSSCSRTCLWWQREKVKSALSFSTTVPGI